MPTRENIADQNTENRNAARYLRAKLAERQRIDGKNIFGKKSDENTLETLDNSYGYAPLAAHRPRNVRSARVSASDGSDIDLTDIFRYDDRKIYASDKVTDNCCQNILPHFFNFLRSFQIIQKINLPRRSAASKQGKYSRKHYITTPTTCQGYDFFLRKKLLTLAIFNDIITMNR